VKKEMKSKNERRKEEEKVRNVRAYFILFYFILFLLLLRYDLACSLRMERVQSHATCLVIFQNRMPWNLIGLSSFSKNQFDKNKLRLS
jgi:hypothetical protein